LTPALSVELLRVAAGADEITLSVRDGAMRGFSLDDRTFPTDADGRIRPRFSPPYKVRTVSAADVLLGRVPEARFERKIVIVGLASIGLEDVVSTPVVSRTYGSDLHAQAIETVLDGALLLRPSDLGKAEIAAGMALAVLAIVFLPALRPKDAVFCVAGGVILIAGGSLAAFAGWNFLVDPVAPLAGGGVPALGCLAALLVETDRHRRRLRTSLAEARVRAARIDGELAAAKEIQLGMLPGAEALSALPERVRVSARLEPARAVGGDLYDAFMLDDRRLYFMVGDVTGKGVPASLFMALAKALSRSVMLREGADLGEAAMTANLEISRENTAEFFVTALFGVLDIETGVVELCNAGHENPLIIRADGSVRVFEMDGGPPLCAFEDFPYPVEPLVLAPEETLVIITDGITEARAPDETLFGRDRLLEILANASGDGIIGALVSAVRAFEAGGEATDDLTVMTVGYLGVRVSGP
jgi:adenylate cyclase